MPKCRGPNCETLPTFNYEGTRIVNKDEWKQRIDILKERYHFQHREYSTEGSNCYQSIF